MFLGRDKNLVTEDLGHESPCADYVYAIAMESGARVRHQNLRRRETGQVRTRFWLLRDGENALKFAGTMRLAIVQRPRARYWRRFAWQHGACLRHERRWSPLVTRACMFYIPSMILEEIITALRTQNPAAALTAGVAHAHELAPVVYAIAGKFCRGVHLLPIDNELLFNGLHVLAAARHPGLGDQVIAIARQSGDQLDQLFPDHVTVSLARLLVSVWDQEADSLFTLIEHAGMAPEANPSYSAAAWRSAGGYGATH
jgi:hypothetical protein